MFCLKHWRGLRGLPVHVYSQFIELMHLDLCVSQLKDYEVTADNVQYLEDVTVSS